MCLGKKSNKKETLSYLAVYNQTASSLLLLVIVMPNNNDGFERPCLRLLIVLEDCRGRGKRGGSLLSLPTTFLTSYPLTVAAEVPWKW